MKTSHILGKLFLIVVSLSFFNCNRNSVIYIYPKLVYCKYDYDIKALDARYKNVPIHRGIHLKNFIKQLVEISPQDLKKYLEARSESSKSKDALSEQLPMNGASVFQVFIDEQGEIESVFLVIKSTPFFDFWATKALLNSQFKPLKTINGQRTKYSVFVTYPIIGGRPVGVYVNGTPWKKKKHHIAGLKMLPLPPANTFDIYEVSEPPFLVQTEKIHPRIPYDRSPSFLISLYAIIIDEKGFVEKIETIDVLDKEWFDEIKRSIYKRRYKPAFLNGKPVKCRIFESLFFWVGQYYMQQTQLWDPSSIKRIE